MAEKNERPIKVVAENRKARFNYAIEDTIEAGIALTGTEVKSVRSGKSTIAESYADSKDGELWLINAHIGPYEQLGDTWARFMGEWLPASGRRIGDGVSYEVYHNTPMDTPKEQLRTEIRIPLAS